MICEFSVHAKSKNNNAKIAFLAGISISAAIFITSLLIDRYKGIVGFAALLMLATSILIYTKYVCAEFYYDITFDTNDVPIFVVRQVVGKRSTTFCRIDIADMVSVEFEKRDGRKPKEKDVKRYFYIPTLFAKDWYKIYVNGRYEKCEIFIECSAEFADLLLNYSKEARENRRLSFEEE